MKKVSELNTQWMKDYARTIMNIIGDGSVYSDKEIKCWSMYNSKTDTDTYSYLVKYGDWDIPVNLRFTSIVRPNIDYLVSSYLGNPFNFSVTTVDKQSLEAKFKDKINQYLDKIQDTIRQKYMTIQTNIEMIEGKKQELQYMLQQEPENEEAAAQLQQIQQQFPIIMMKMEQMSNMLSRELARENEKLDAMSILSKFTAKDIREDLAHRKMKSMFEDDCIGEEHRLSFIDKCVTGRNSIYVNIENNKLVYRQVPSLAVRIPKTTSIRYGEQLPWQVLDERYPLEYVINRWGDYMSAEELKRLKSRDKYSEGVYSNNSNGYNYVENKGGGMSMEGVRVTRIFFQETAKIQYKVSPGKNGTPHVHPYNGEDKLKPTDSIKTKYKSYAFEGTVIDGNIYVGFNKLDQQILKIDDYGWNELPIVTDSFDDVSRIPYSLIWATKDLQALNTIIEYYKELLLVISGVKGFVMDESQLPSGMGKKEWMYFRKLGVMWIETYKKERRTQQLQYNQFQQFDDTISNSVQYLDMMQNRIQQQVDQITGVSRHARGELQPRDPVGTTQMAIQATSIIADVLFWEHDQVIRRALTRALNLYCKFIAKDGDILNIFDKTMGVYAPMKIPSGLLDGADYDLKVMNNNKDFRNLESMRQVIMNEYSKGGIDIKGFASLMNTDSIQELTAIAQTLVDKADDMRSRMQQEAANVQREMIQFEKNLEAQIQAPMQQLKQYELQLKKLDLDLKDKQLIFEAEYKKSQLETDSFLKAMDIMAEREVELKYLDEQKQSRQVDDILQQATLITNMILGKEQNMLKDKEISMRPKEKIKDSGKTIKS